MCETFFKEVQKSFSAADQIFFVYGRNKNHFSTFWAFSKTFWPNSINVTQEIKTNGRQIFEKTKSICKKIDGTEIDSDRE
jgi:hypothetical protein